MPEPKVTTEEAKEILNKERETKRSACEKEIAEVLSKHACDIAFMGMNYQDGRFYPLIRVVNKE